MRLSFGNQMTLMSFSWRHEVKHGFSFRGHDQHSHLMKNAAVKFITTDQRSIFRISNLAYALLCELRENTIQFQRSIVYITRETDQARTVKLHRIK